MPWLLAAGYVALTPLSRHGNAPRQVEAVFEPKRRIGWKAASGSMPACGVEHAADGAPGVVAGTTPLKLVLTMNPARGRSLPRITPSLYVICG
jgi:hypothetical protein